jgi:uncharacterized protein YchJ
MSTACRVIESPTTARRLAAHVTTSAWVIAFNGTCRLYERSRFERRRGRWVYVDGCLPVGGPGG